MAVIINGVRFEGNNLSISGGRVTIDGRTVDEAAQGVVEVQITEGSPVSVTSDAVVRCGDVSGNVRAGMDVNCGDVRGDVRAGMSVNCQDVSGDVEAGMGVNVRGRR